MCKWLSDLFNRAPKLPHPEESINTNATIDNVNPGDLIYIINKWLYDWKVPVEYHPFWLSVNITVVPKLTILYNGQFVQVPAATWAEERRMELDPQWANAGVLAHEFSHISYSLLTPEQQAQFSAKFYYLRDTDLLTLFEQKPYGLTNLFEGHADVYRYLGEKMPAELRPFYPKLL